MMVALLGGAHTHKPGKTKNQARAGGRNWKQEVKIFFYVTLALGRIWFSASGDRHISDEGGGALTGGLVLMNDSL